eukprot:scpid26778/ scgid25290/ 
MNKSIYMYFQVPSIITLFTSLLHMYFGVDVSHGMKLYRCIVICKIPVYPERSIAIGKYSALHVCASCTGPPEPARLVTSECMPLRRSCVLPTISDMNCMKVW